ncbi:MAG: histidine phosphatase family protein [Ilumatobacteraceae bacterium]
MHEPAMVEWSYGEYEGLTTPEIREHVPGWTVWTHETPGGETPGDVGDRVDGLIDRVIAGGTRRTLVFTHAHVGRARRTMDRPSAERGSAIPARHGGCVGALVGSRSPRHRQLERLTPDPHALWPS